MNKPTCVHCGAEKTLETGLCGKCFRFPIHQESVPPTIKPIYLLSDTEIDSELAHRGHGVIAFTLNRDEKLQLLKQDRLEEEALLLFERVEWDVEAAEMERRDRICVDQPYPGERFSDFEGHLEGRLED